MKTAASMPRMMAAVPFIWPVMKSTTTTIAAAMRIILSIKPIFLGIVASLVYE
jgi:hypothetical protein